MVFEAGDVGGCSVEHDFDAFDGGRYGGEYYTGRLLCCGAEHQFHRHFSTSNDYTRPELCFDGAHTSNPEEVEYNDHTIEPCSAARCGKHNAKRAKLAYEAQQQKKAEKQAKSKARREQARSAAKAQVAQANTSSERRAARRLRAEVLPTAF